MEAWVNHPNVTAIVRRLSFVVERLSHFTLGLERHSRSRGGQRCHGRFVRSLQPQVSHSPPLHAYSQHFELHVFSGKLPYTIAKSVSDYSAQLITSGSGIVPIPYNEGIFIDYMHFDQVRLMLQSFWTLLT